MRPRRIDGLGIQSAAAGLDPIRNGIDVLGGPDVDGEAEALERRTPRSIPPGRAVANDPARGPQIATTPLGLIASLPPRIIGNLAFTSGTRLCVCAEPK